jgi:hypothetical protein
MSLKLITTPDTLKLHPTSYERGVMIDCFDKLKSDDMPRQNYLSDAVVKKMRDFVESQYIVFYFVDSYTYAVKDYHDKDGDYINSDSETNTYPTPMEEMVASLTEMGYNDATKMIKDAVITDHDINLYYGERISLQSYSIKVEGI